MTEPPLRTWQRIIWELEQAPDMEAPLEWIAVSSGYERCDRISSNLATATNYEPRLYEWDEGGVVWIGLHTE